MSEWCLSVTVSCCCLSVTIPGWHPSVARCLLVTMSSVRWCLLVTEDWISGRNSIPSVCFPRNCWVENGCLQAGPRQVVGPPPTSFKAKGHSLACLIAMSSITLNSMHHVFSEHRESTLTGNECSIVRLWLWNAVSKRIRDNTTSLTLYLVSGNYKIQSIA